MREIEHLSHLYIAYQFLLAEDTKERSAEELKEMQDKIVFRNSSKYVMP